MTTRLSLGSTSVGAHPGRPAGMRSIAKGGAA
jgi:hypothetical protein